MRCCTGLAATNATSWPSNSGVSARSGVMSSTIQMPRPCVAENELVVARMNRDVAHCHRGKATALELRPALAAIDRNEETELGSEEEQVRLDQIFFDHVRVTLNAGELLRT